MNDCICLIKKILISLFIVIMAGNNAAAEKNLKIDEGQRHKQAKGVFSLYVLIGGIASPDVLPQEGKVAFPDFMIPTSLRDFVSREEIEMENDMDFLKKQQRLEEAKAFHRRYEEDYKEWKEEENLAFISNNIIGLSLIMFLVLALLSNKKYFKKYCS